MTVHTLTIQWFSTDGGVPVTVVPGQYSNHINHLISNACSVSYAFHGEQ